MAGHYAAHAGALKAELAAAVPRPVLRQLHRLPALQRALAPFVARRGLRARGYGELVAGWIVHNHAPHTDWGAAGGRPSLAP